ncbi:uncharacterized protein, partial [Mycetomoellerius zeteki]|uniref:uncharacterized protein n=1 Tax=Mycetomoellerius zeteki TaxID=64791 RepID=UPI00084E75F4
MAEVERSLKEIERCINFHNNKAIIIGGDFNAKNKMWQSLTTNPRGTLVAKWASEQGLVCLNHGGISTCIHGKGESIVDLTFANQTAAARVTEWKVSLIESSSDHRYIETTIGKTSAQISKEKRSNHKRWAIKKLNEDMLKSGIIIGNWINGNQQAQDPETKATKLQEMMTDACEIAMPKSMPKLRKAMPWWNEELAQLRETSTRARRKIKRARRNGHSEDSAETQDKISKYKEARKKLSKALRKAKAVAWTDFVNTINENPWGRPYLTVMGKLRRWTPPYTESLEESTRNRVIDGLFPAPTQLVETWIEPALPEEGFKSWQEDFTVTTAELKTA